jgi:hypothetical protein
LSGCLAVKVHGGYQERIELPAQVFGFVFGQSIAKEPTRFEVFEKHVSKAMCAFDGKL